MNALTVLGHIVAVAAAPVPSDTSGLGASLKTSVGDPIFLAMQGLIPAFLLYRYIHSLSEHRENAFMLLVQAIIGGIASVVVFGFLKGILIPTGG